MKYSKRYNTAQSLNSPKPQFLKTRTDQMARSCHHETHTPGPPNTNTKQVGQDDNKLKSENKYDSIHLLCLQSLAQSESRILISISFGPRRGEEEEGRDLWEDASGGNSTVPTFLR